MNLEDLVSLWRLAEGNRVAPGAEPHELEVFEETVGWHLPAEFRELYSACNGADLFGGSLSLAPLFSRDDYSFEDLSEDLRQAEWPVPEELQVFGDNGEGDYFGLWIPAVTTESAPIVEIGQIFEVGCMGVVGRTLKGFLLHRSAFFGIDDPSISDALGVPESMRHLQSEVLWEDLALWADPTASLGDAYRDELSPEGVTAWLRAAQNQS